MHQQQQQQPMPPTATWFSGAPLTKIWVCGSVGVAVYRQVWHPTSWSFDSDKFDVVSAITSKLFFTSREWFFATVLLALWMRRMEREMGSRKLFVLLTGITALTIFQEVMVVSMTLLSWSYAGPYHWIGALFCLYHQYTPRLYPQFVGVLGVNFSEKSLYYAAAWHVILSAYSRSTAPVIMGGISCALIMSVLTPLLDSIPPWVIKTVSIWGERFAERPPPAFVPVLAAPPPTRRAPPRPPPTPPPPPPPQPAESLVEQLMAMGFERQPAVEALQQTNNDLTRAVNLLLAQGAVM